MVSKVSVAVNYGTYAKVVQSYVRYLGVLATSGSSHPPSHGNELTKPSCLHGGKDQSNSSQIYRSIHPSWRPLLLPPHLKTPKPLPPWTRTSKRSVPTVNTLTVINLISYPSAVNPAKVPTVSITVLKQDTSALAPASGRPQGGKLLRFLQLQIVLLRESRLS